MFARAHDDLDCHRRPRKRRSRKERRSFPARSFGIGTRAARDPSCAACGLGERRVLGYQQPVLAKAGYRVIGYSRRGYLKSYSWIRTIRASARRICTICWPISASLVSRRGSRRGWNHRHRLCAVAPRAIAEPDARIDDHGRHRQEL